jgi:mono/diheme cytochrome c family protein
MRTRLTFLIATLGIAVVAVACGRASQADIDSALGITPTATLSAEQIASATAGAGTAQAAGTGDVAQGRVQYQLRCLNCHRPNNTLNAPVLSGPDNPSTQYTDEELKTLVRTGEGHSTPPGPLSEVTISESQLNNIIAFIRDQSK